MMILIEQFDAFNTGLQLRQGSENQTLERPHNSPVCPVNLFKDGDLKPQMEILNPKFTKIPVNLSNSSQVSNSILGFGCKFTII